MKEQSTQQVRLWTTDFILLMLCNFLLFLQLHMIVSPLPSYVQERFHANAFEVSLFTCLFALSAIQPVSIPRKHWRRVFVTP